MRRIAVLIASAAINASTIPAVAAENTSNKDIDASRVRWATVFQIFTASPLPSSGRPSRTLLTLTAREGLPQVYHRAR